MNSIALVTKTKITADKVSKLLIDNFSHSKKITQNDNSELFIGKMPNNFYIVYDDCLSLDDEKCMLFEEDLKAIPFKEGFYNNLFFHNIEIAKYVIKVISGIYKELLVLDEDDFVGTAEEYISCH